MATRGRRLDSLRELDAAERFFRFSELQFCLELNKLKKRERSRSKSYWRQELDFGTTYGDCLSDEYAEVREMQRLIQVASYSGLNKIDVGVYISTTAEFRKRMKVEFGQNWEGSLTFEKISRYLPHFKSAIQVPILVLGIEF